MFWGGLIKEGIYRNLQQVVNDRLRTWRKNSNYELIRLFAGNWYWTSRKIIIYCTFWQTQPVKFLKQRQNPQIVHLTNSSTGKKMFSKTKEGNLTFSFLENWTWTTWKIKTNRTVQHFLTVKVKEQVVPARRFVTWWLCCFKTHREQENKLFEAVFEIQFYSKRVFECSEKAMFKKNGETFRKQKKKFYLYIMYKLRKTRNKFYEIWS